MKETETTRNSHHTDPDHRVAADRVSAECGGSSTSGIAQAPRWKYVFPDVCKKTQKSFIRLLAPLGIYLFIWRCINSFYTCIHEVAGDRALLPVEEHIVADAIVADTWQTAVSQHLSIDVHLVPSLAGMANRCGYTGRGRFLHSDGDPGAATLEWRWG